MKHLKSFCIASGLLLFASITSAQTAPVAENISTSRAQTLAILTEAPVLEFSNSQQKDIVSYFSRNLWRQASLQGELLGDIPIQITRQGHVCIDGSDNCFAVEAVSDGWYIVSPNSGTRSDDKHMRYVRQ